MDAKLFAPGAPGRLVPAPNRYHRPDTGFIPDPLPRAWTPPPATRALLAQATAAMARLRAAGERSGAPQLAAQFLQLREAARSSVADRSAQATAALLSFAPLAEGPYRDARKAWRKAWRYRAVLRAGHAAFAGPRPPQLRALLEQIHAGLFEGKPRRSVFPGRLRRGPIQMGDTARYVPPPYAWVVPCLAALERSLAQSSAHDPLVFACMTHYQVASIHPFADGNGRVSRILLALMLNRALGAEVPLLYPGAYFARHRRAYSDLQFRVNTHGEWPAWIDFCLQAVIAEADDGARRIVLLDELRGRWRAGAFLDELIATLAFSEPRFAALCRAHGREARAEMARLQRGGILRAAEGSPRHYYLPGAVALLTRDVLP